MSSEMPNLPQEPIEPPFNDQSLPSDEAIDPELTFPQYGIAVLKCTFTMMRSMLIILPIAFVLVMVVLALLGPAVGNVFSNIVNTL